MSDSSLHIRGRGTYQFDADVYAQWMEHTKDALCREIFARGYADEHGATKAEYWALRAYQLAAILAESDTGARANEREAAAREARIDATLRGYVERLRALDA